MSKNPKNWGKLMKIANIDREFLHIFWTTWGNSMKFSGKMCLEIILKVTKNQCFTLSLAEIFFEKSQARGGEGGGRGVGGVSLISLRHVRVKKDLCNANIKSIEDKILNISTLASNTTLNAKINEV